MMESFFWPSTFLCVLAPNHVRGTYIYKSRASGTATMATILSATRQLVAACNSLPPHTPATPPKPITMSAMPMNSANKYNGIARRVIAATAGHANAAPAPNNARAMMAPVKPSHLLNNAAAKPVVIATTGSNRAVPKRSINSPAGICTTANAIRNAVEIKAVCNVLRPRSWAISGRSGAYEFSIVC